MKPQEKAAELINKFLRIEDDTTFYWEPYFDMKYTDREVLPHAKRCAILVCEEMIADFEKINHVRAYFWQLVMEEIKTYRYDNISK